MGGKMAEDVELSCLLKEEGSGVNGPPSILAHQMNMNQEPFKRASFQRVLLAASIVVFGFIVVFKIQLPTGHIDVKRHIDVKSQNNENFSCKWSPNKAGSRIRRGC